MTIIKLKKKAIRMINLSKYNAHTEPILKSLKFQVGMDQTKHPERNV